MAKPLMDDQLWQIVEPLLPKPKRRRRRYPGRRPLDNRTVMAGLLFVLKTGIAWEDLPAERYRGAPNRCDPGGRRGYGLRPDHGGEPALADGDSGSRHDAYQLGIGRASAEF